MNKLKQSWAMRLSLLFAILLGANLLLHGNEGLSILAAACFLSFALLAVLNQFKGNEKMNGCLLSFCIVASIVSAFVVFLCATVGAISEGEFFGTWVVVSLMACAAMFALRRKPTNIMHGVLIGWNMCFIVVTAHYFLVVIPTLKENDRKYGNLDLTTSYTSTAVDIDLGALKVPSEFDHYAMIQLADEVPKNPEPRVFTVHGRTKGHTRKYVYNRDKRTFTTYVDGKLRHTYGGVDDAAITRATTSTEVMGHH